MTEVLLISKPVNPPWNDSSKNLARDLAAHLTQTRVRVLVEEGQMGPADSVIAEPVYGAPVGFALDPHERLRVLRRLLIGDSVPLWHFFFAPSVRAGLVAKGLALMRRVRTVQTVCSRPRTFERLGSMLFADRTVVLSRTTERAILAHGYPADRVRRIPPSVPVMETVSERTQVELRRRTRIPTGAPLALYPGDLEVGRGAERSLRLLGAEGLESLHLVMACRNKTNETESKRAALRTCAEAIGVADRLHWVGETPDIQAWLATTDVVLMPSDDLYAKMDYPLVVLEAMAHGTVSVVSKDTASAELTDFGGVVAVGKTDAELATTVGSILTERDRHLRLTESAQKARRLFTPEAMARAYETLYRELLDER